MPKRPDGNLQVRPVQQVEMPLRSLDQQYPLWCPTTEAHGAQIGDLLFPCPHRTGIAQLPCSEERLLILVAIWLSLPKNHTGHNL